MYADSASWFFKKKKEDHELKKERIWDQMITDIMSDWEFALNNLMTGFINDNKFKTVFLSDPIIIEYKTTNYLIITLFSTMY